MLRQKLLIYREVLRPLIVSQIRVTLQQRRAPKCPKCDSRCTWGAKHNGEDAETATGFDAVVPVGTSQPQGSNLLGTRGFYVGSYTFPDVSVWVLSTFSSHSPKTGGGRSVDNFKLT